MNKNKGKYEINIKHVKAIMQNMLNGFYAIPTYQRDYVWGAPKIASLVNSLQEGCPIGVITTAPARNSLLAKGKNEVIDILSGGATSSDVVVVDGQQRLTSLAIVYYAHEISTSGKVKTDQLKRTLSKLFNNLFFYNGKLITKDQLNDMEELSEAEKTEISRICHIANKEINDEVKSIFDPYTLHEMKLQNWDDKSIIDIFSAMNSGGKPLTHIELMNGSMFNISDGKFVLDKKIKDFNNELGSVGNLKPDLFVQLIKIYYDIKIDRIVLDREKGRADYSKKSLINFSMSEKMTLQFIEKYSDFTQTIKNTLAFLESTYFFKSLDMIPKTPYILSSFAVFCNSQLDEKELNLLGKKVISQISRRLVIQDYASSPGAKAADDINNYLLKLIRNNKDDPANQSYSGTKIFENSKTLHKFIEERVSDARYKNKNTGLFKLFTSALISKNPKYLFTNQHVHVTANSLKEKDVNLDHFVAVNSDLRKKLGISDKDIDAITNISLLSEEENKKIGKKEAGMYLLESYKTLGEVDFKTMIESHMFNHEVVMKIINKFETRISPYAYDMVKFMKELWSKRKTAIADHVINVFFKDLFE